MRKVWNCNCHDCCLPQLGKNCLGPKTVTYPSEEFEFTTKSQWAHNETHSDSFWQLLSSSQRTQKMNSHCELSVSLQLTPWACWELFMRSSLWANHAVVTVSSLWVGLLWAHCVSSLWSHSDVTYLPHSVRFRWAHCEHGVSSPLHWANI